MFGPSSLQVDWYRPAVCGTHILVHPRLLQKFVSETFELVDNIVTDDDRRMIIRETDRHALVVRDILDAVAKIDTALLVLSHARGVIRFLKMKHVYPKYELDAMTSDFAAIELAELTYRRVLWDELRSEPR